MTFPRSILLLLILLACATVAIGQTAVRWPIQKRYTNAGFNDDLAITYASGSSRAVTVAYGGNGGNIVSRHALNGSGSFSFKMVFSPGSGTNVRVGLDASSTFVSGTEMDYQIDSFGNVKDGLSFVADVSPVSTTSTYSFEISGTTLTLKKDSTTLHTFSTAVTLPIYLHLQAIDAGTGISDVVVTGTTASEPSPPSAPTIAATAGHKRNHIQITYPSGANGVAIYRGASEGAIDFTTPIVTEWRLPYFEDTGLTNGTTYFYKAKATVDGMGESTASSVTSATPTNLQLPSISSDVALIVGVTQVKPIGDTPLSYWFDRLNEQEAFKWGTTGPKKSEFDSVSGTVSVTNGSKTVTGSSTTFLTDYRNDGYIKITDSGATERVYQIYWITSDTSMVLWDPYTGATESGRTARPWWHILQNDGYFAGFLHYYDLSLSLYHAYLRTGAPYLLQLFRENADAWHSWVAHEQDAVFASDGHYMFTSPRQQALAGLALRSLDGQNYWLRIELAARESWAVWIQVRLNSGPPPNNWFDGVRDQAYVIQSCAILAKMHPTEAVRNEFLPHALAGINQYFEWQMGRYSDRHVPRIEVLEPSAGVFAYHYHQPFIDAIYGEAAAMVHKLTNDNAVKTQFTAYMSGVHNDYDNRLITGAGIPAGTRMRSVFYSRFHSSDGTGTNVPPYTDPMDADAQGGAGDPDLPEPVSYDLGSFPIYESRFANNITISNFGYAYYLTGNTNYIDQGEDRLDASYGDATGVFSDTFNSFGALRGTGKNFNESFRRGANFLAYRDVIAPLSGSGVAPSFSLKGKTRLGGKVKL